MINDSVNRKKVRKHLAALLAENLSGEGKPAQKVYPYQAADFAPQNPVIIVTGGSAHRGSVEEKEKDLTGFRIWVHTFTLYADESNAWTEEESEDFVDDLEKGVADIVRDNSVPTEDSWFTLSHDGESIVEPLIDGGLEYRHEAIPLRATCWDPWST